MEENKKMEAAVEEEVKKETEEASEDSKASDETKASEGTETLEETSEEEAAPKKEDKGFFKKKADKKDEQIEELKDRLMRNMAEFDNFRKRSEKEKSQMFEVGAKDVVEKILPVIDNFERGLAAIPEDLKENPFTLGMEQIYKQFLTVLESAGVTPIDAVGKEFDPNFHNAVMHDEDKTLGENIIVEEFQKGYMYRDSVVRHSMVKVVN